VQLDAKFGLTRAKKLPISQRVDVALLLYIDALLSKIVIYFLLYIFVYFLVKFVSHLSKIHILKSTF